MHEVTSNYHQDIAIKNNTSQHQQQRYFHNMKYLIVTLHVPGKNENIYLGNALLHPVERK